MTLKQLLITFSIFLLLISSINYKIRKHMLENESNAWKPVKVVTHAPVQKDTLQKKSPAPGKIVYKLIPDDPAKYGFISHSKKSKVPRTVEEWERHFEKVVQENEVFTGEGGGSALNTMQTNPEDYQKQISKLDEHIDIYEKKKIDDPLDEKVEKQLQQLYRLKALGKVMKEKVVNPSQPPVLLEPITALP